jgi:hypothetical protein
VLTLGSEIGGATVAIELPPFKNIRILNAPTAHDPSGISNTLHTGVRLSFSRLSTESNLFSIRAN